MKPPDTPGASPVQLRFRPTVFSTTATVRPGSPGSVAVMLVSVALPLIPLNCTPPGALGRVPKARTSAEAQFLAIGDGAGLWLAEAAAAGTSRLRAKMARAVQLTRLHDAAAVDRALGRAAAAGRFAEHDLTAILAHQATAAPGEASRASEQATLAQGTSGWARHGGQEAAR
jgi:hypothetical protein